MPVMNSKNLSLASDANLNKLNIPKVCFRSLKPFQFEGVRFLHEVYQAEDGAVLNDDSGLGKTIQSVVFTSSILDKSSSANCLVICDESEFDHWMYHIQNWSNHSVTILNDKTNSNYRFYLCSPKKAIESQEKFWKIVIVDDLHLNNIVKKFKASCKFKIWLAQDNLLDHTDYLFGILKWISHKIVIPENEFDYSNKLETNIFDAWCQRQKLNVFCRRWLLRRTKNMVLNSLPLISPKVYEENFNAWKKETHNNSNDFFMSSDTPEILKNNSSDASLILIEDNPETIEIINSDSDHCSPSILSPKKNQLMKLANNKKSDDFKRKGTKDITGLKFKRSKNNPTNTPENNNDMERESSKCDRPHFLEILFNNDKKTKHLNEFNPTEENLE